MKRFFALVRRAVLALLVGENRYPKLAPMRKTMPSFNQTPDKPRSFGYKTFWFVVKASDPASVLETLGLAPATTANWESGLAATYSSDASPKDDPWVFASPAINGWVLVVSDSFPYPVAIEDHRDIGEKFDLLFSRLMKRFDDVQFFGGHRVAGFVTWARALKSKPTRIFGFADGDALANFGVQTSEEAQLGFADLSGLSPSDACDKILDLAAERDAEERTLTASGIPPKEARAKIRASGRHPIPDETDVVDLAALWSIDPTRLSDQDHPVGLGLAVRLPNDLMQ